MHAKYYNVEAARHGNLYHLDKSEGKMWSPALKKQHQYWANKQKALKQHVEHVEAEYAKHVAEEEKPLDGDSDWKEVVPVIPTPAPTPVPPTPVPTPTTPNPTPSPTPVNANDMRSTSLYKNDPDATSAAYKCAKEFVVATPGGLQKDGSIQGCCVLDHALNIAVILHALETCKHWTRHGDSNGHCAMGTKHYQQLKAIEGCCHTHHYATDNSQAFCMRTVIPAAKHYHSYALPAFEQCVGMLGPPMKNLCKIAQGELVTAAKKLGAAAATLYGSASVDERTPLSSSFMSTLQSATEIDSYMQSFGAIYLKEKRFSKIG
jgi:hypothetical protein